MFSLAKKFSMVPVILIAFMAFGSMFASAASADSTSPETGYAHSKVTSVAFKAVQLKGWIGVQEHIRIQKVPASQCEEFADFYNSNYVLGQTSQKPQMYEDHNGYLCRDKYSPTGWVKRGGGHTGADCGNIAQPKSEKPKYKVVQPPSAEVNSTSHLKVKVKVTVHAAASIHLSCGNASGKGFAYDMISVDYSTYVKAQANKSLQLKLAAKVVAQAKDKAAAEAKVQCNAPVATPEAPKPPAECKFNEVKNAAGNCVSQTNNAEQNCKVQNGTFNNVTQNCTIIQINANCSNVTVTNGSGNVVENYQEGNCNVTEEKKEEHPSPPPPPPAKHTTEISCTGFEEISGGGSFLVDCAVSDDNGAPISLEAHSNNSNTRVSGINCYSNGGSQTCPSGGTFEFRVSGMNSGSSVVYSSITATASANGVKATFTSDSSPVDPEDGGF